MNIEKKLRNLKNTYPSNLTKETFNKMMYNFKILFNLNNNQINEFFNLLSEEGKKDVYFSDFKDLVLLINDNKNTFLVKIKIKKKFYYFLEKNFEKLTTKFEFSDFRDFIFKNGFCVKDDKLFKIFQIIVKNYSVNNVNLEKNFFEKNFEIIEKEKKNVSCLSNNFENIIDYLKYQFDYILSKFNNLKNNFNFENLNSCENEFFNFKDNIFLKLKELEKTNKTIEKRNEFLKNRIREFKIIINQSNKNFYQNLKENENLKKSLSNLKNEKLKLKKIIENNNFFNQKENTIFDQNKISASENHIKNKNLKKQFVTFENKYNEFSNMLQKKLNKNFKGIPEKKLKELLTKTYYRMEETKNNIKKKENFYKSQIYCLKKKLNKIENSKKSKNTVNLTTSIKRNSSLKQQTSIYVKNSEFSKKNKSISKISLKKKESSISSNISKKTHKIAKNDQNNSISSKNPKNLKNLQKTQYPYFSKIKRRLKSVSILQNIESLKYLITKDENPIPKKTSLNFKSLCYICSEKSKTLNTIKIKSEEIIFKDFSKKKELRIITKRLLSINYSSQNPFLLKIFFNNENSKKESLIIEICESIHFLSILQESQHFSENLIKKKNFFEIEKNKNFNDCSIFIFKNYSNCGLVRLWVNSLFYNWVVINLILVDRVLFYVEMPTVIYYSNFSGFRKFFFFKLDHFTVMKSRKGISVPNIFAIKMINQDKDLVISTSSQFLADKWTNAFYSIFEE